MYFFLPVGKTSFLFVFSRFPFEYVRAKHRNTYPLLACKKNHAAINPWGVSFLQIMIVDDAQRLRLRFAGPAGRIAGPTGSCPARAETSN